MNKTIWLFKFADIQLSAKPNVLFGTLVLWLGLASIGVWGLDLSIGAALLGGSVAALLHWFGELWHQYGHAYAAKRTGYPMIGISLWWLLGRSIYPKDEPDLPAEIHIRRALGGIPASLIMTLLSGIVVWLLQGYEGAAIWVAVFFFFENILVFVLGALLPLGFTDGSTLLYWLPKRNKKP